MQPAATIKHPPMLAAAKRQADDRAARENVFCFVYHARGLWYVRTASEGVPPDSDLEYTAIPDRIVAYLGNNGNLIGFRGERLGIYLIVSTWRTPRSYVSTTMHQVEAVVNGITYTGRSTGVGMSYVGRRKAARKGN